MEDLDVKGAQMCMCEENQRYASISLHIIDPDACSVFTNTTFLNHLWAVEQMSKPENNIRCRKFLDSEKTKGVPEIAFFFFFLHSLPFKDKFHADLTYAVAILYPFTSTILSVGILLVWIKEKWKECFQYGSRKTKT